MVYIVYISSFCQCFILLGEFLLPPSNNLQFTYREVLLIMKEIGMDYQSIDACPNDHIIYYGKYASENRFSLCELNRYRIDQLTKNIPLKFIRYIPIITHFQRLSSFQSIAQFMDYHEKNRSEDGVL